MPEAIRRTKGRGASYRFDRGGTPADPGPFIGVVKNNVDPARMGRLQVYIEQFSGGDESNEKLWRTVSYLPPFYGSTYVPDASPSGAGTFLTNQQSYGMWFTPPDLGVSVICFFIEGDPNQGYYVGVVPDEGINHMVPAIGASRNYSLAQAQQDVLSGAALLPVTEINTGNNAIALDPRFFDRVKPVHTYVAAILFQQGLVNDQVRGPITSSSQRESPSTVYGVITPGRPIYQGGLTDQDIKEQLESEQLRPQDIAVIGRRGGHSIVMDDGDLTGRDNLIRIRTAKGHQITMSDEADCLYIIAANGQTWIELGSEGTVDVYSTNSVNVRSQGEINLHADKNINICAGENLNIRAGNIAVESQNTMAITSVGDLTAFSKTKVGVLSDGSIALQSDIGGWRCSGSLALKAGRIDLNGGPAPEPVKEPVAIKGFKLDDTQFVDGVGWQVQPGLLDTIVPRAPTHEPYPYHNLGVPVEIQVAAQPPQPPTAAVASALGSVENIPLVTPSVSDALGSQAGVAASGALSQAASVSGAVSGAVSQATSTVSNAVSTATAPLSAGVPSGVAAAIDSAAVLSTKAADVKVGNLDKAAVTGLLAQTKTAVGQASNVISVDKGIGQFGLKPNQLEAAGFLKPGTVSSISAAAVPAVSAEDIAEATRINNEGGSITPEQVAQNKKINSILSSPMSWAGKSGVGSLDNLLGNEKLQSAAQQGLMASSLEGLRTSGLATGLETPAVLSGLVQSATTLGVGSLNDFVKGGASPDIQQAIGATIKGAQFSTSFVDQKLGDFTSLPGPAIAAAQTVDRTVVDTGVQNVLDDPKIPAPTFGPAERVPEDPELLSIDDEAKATVLEAVEFLDSVKALIDLAIEESVRLDALQPLTTQQIDDFAAQREQYRALFNNNWKQTYVPKLDALEESRFDPVRSYVDASLTSISRLVKFLVTISQSQAELIKLWRENAVTTT
jgi:hypothetical protein